MNKIKKIILSVAIFGLIIGVVGYQALDTKASVNTGWKTATVVVSADSWTNPSYGLVEDGNSAETSGSPGNINSYYALSWDGGSSWTSFYGGLGNPGTGLIWQYWYYESPADETYTWGRTWSDSELSDDNFQLQIRWGGTSPYFYYIVDTFGFDIPAGATIDGIKVGQKNSYSGGHAFIDSLKAIVYYTEAATPCEAPTEGTIWDVALSENCHITDYQQFNGTLNCFGTGSFVVDTNGTLVVEKINCPGIMPKGTGKIIIKNIP
ncbi:MAG TPA: hypothetical protein PKZ42_01790 [Syntrophales bacterium]|nr:hypothetical protein [Syntrophales bacterium]